MIFNGAVDFPGDVKHQEEQYGPENRVFTLEQNQKRYPKADGEDKERRQKFKEPVLPLPPRRIIFLDYHGSRLHSRQTTLPKQPPSNVIYLSALSFATCNRGFWRLSDKKLPNVEQPIPEDWNEQRRLYGFPER